MQLLRVSKEQAAYWQLQQAVTLFNQNGCVISIHTLAHASLEIFNCILNNSGVLRFKDFIFETLELKTKEEKAKFWKDFSKSRSFMKHADRDIDEDLIFPPQINRDLIAIAITHLQRLNVALTEEMKKFLEEYVNDILQKDVV